MDTIGVSTLIGRRTILKAGAAFGLLPLASSCASPVQVAEDKEVKIFARPCPPPDNGFPNNIYKNMLAQSINIAPNANLGPWKGTAVTATPNGQGPIQSPPYTDSACNFANFQTAYLLNFTNNNNLIQMTDLTIRNLITANTNWCASIYMQPPSPDSGVTFTVNAVNGNQPISGTNSVIITGPNLTLTGNPTYPNACLNGMNCQVQQNVNGTNWCRVWLSIAVTQGYPTGNPQIVVNLTPTSAAGLSLTVWGPQIERITNLTDAPTAFGPTN